MVTGESSADQLMNEAEIAEQPKEFDRSKASVKGLVDSGITKVPPIFIDTKKKLHDDLEQQHSNKDPTFTLPIIDLNGVAENPNLRAEVVERIRDAVKKWGFFLIKNHGIPESIVDEMIEGVRRFHDQDVEIKNLFYSRDRTGRFIYNSNFASVNGLAANWRDTVECNLAPHQLDPEDVPLICRDSFMNYSKQIMNLGTSLLELLSESLGLKPDYLKEEMHCAEGAYLLANYYPPCPEPNLTWGISDHTDGGFLTILLQDGVGGLQVLHDNQWLDVPCLPGTLIINIADLLQLISNDRFKSPRHRVVAQEVGPRISVACNLKPGIKPRLFGPIQELLSEENPAIYKKITFEDYKSVRFAKRPAGSCFLTPFKLKQAVGHEELVDHNLLKGSV